MKAKIRREILKTLAAAPDGYPLPESTLAEEVLMSLIPRPTIFEYEQVRDDLQREHLIAGVNNANRGQTVWSITDAGKLSLAGI